MIYKIVQHILAEHPEYTRKQVNKSFHFDEIDRGDENYHFQIFFLSSFLGKAARKLRENFAKASSQGSFEVSIKNHVTNLCKVLDVFPQARRHGCLES